MNHIPRDDDELDALLRQPTERLAPPDGSWEGVTRRARRRKWAKASVALTAGVIVVAGAVPAVIAVRHNSDDQTITLANKGPNQSLPNTAGSVRPAPGVSASPAPAVDPSLAGFVPESLSFMSQTEGFLWGSIGTSRQGVVAHTTDSGAHWTRLPAPDVNATVGTGRGGDGQIRFGHFDNATVGFIFGANYYVTTDDGATWTPYSSPGYIDDLEIMQGRVWALVRTSKLAGNAQLFSATVADPTLRPVSGVPKMGGPAGADSIAVNGQSVDVIVGSSSFYSSPNGVKWHPGQNPCQDQPGLGSVESTLLTTLNLGGVVAACGYDQSGATEAKRVFVTTKSGKHWTPTAANPAPSGYLENLAAGTQHDMVIGTVQGGAQITYDGGAHWAPLDANGTALGFVGFINLDYIVGITAPANASTGAFAASTDSGSAWSVVPFTR